MTSEQRIARLEADLRAAQRRERRLLAVLRAVQMCAHAATTQPWTVAERMQSLREAVDVNPTAQE